MKAFFLLFICLSFFNKVFAHGEDKLGPNGGYIQMLGSFHTEIVPFSDKSIKVYLLDFNFKNPEVKKSQVKLEVLNKKTHTADCKVVKDYFLCEFINPIDLNLNGKVTIRAQRGGDLFYSGEYLLPLNKVIQKPTEDHSHH